MDVQTGHYVGFLDTRDLVQFVVFQAEEAELVKKHQVRWQITRCVLVLTQCLLLFSDYCQEDFNTA